MRPRINAPLLISPRESHRRRRSWRHSFAAAFVSNVQFRATLAGHRKRDLEINTRRELKYLRNMEPNLDKHTTR